MKILMSIALLFGILHEKLAKALVTLLIKASDGGLKLLLYIVPALALAFLIGVYSVVGGIITTFIKTLFLIRRYIDELTENNQTLRKG